MLRRQKPKLSTSDFNRLKTKIQAKKALQRGDDEDVICVKELAEKGALEKQILVS